MDGDCCNYLVLFIEYDYQTLVVVYSILYRYHLILLLYFFYFFLLLHCKKIKNKKNCVYTLYPYNYIYVINVMILPLMGP